MERLWGLFSDVLFLRIATVSVSILLVPAFVFGMVSVWCLVFAVLISLLFRANLFHLNAFIDQSGNLRNILHRVRFVGLCLECAVYMAMSLGLFFSAYSTGLFTWPPDPIRGLDKAMQFFEHLSLISFSKIVDLSANPALYTIAVAHILAHFALVGLLLIAGRELFRNGMKVKCSIARGRYSGTGLEFHLSGHIGTISLFTAILLAKFERDFGSGVVVSLANNRGLFLNHSLFYLMVLVFPFFLVVLLATSAFRFCEYLPLRRNPEK